MHEDQRDVVVIGAGAVGLSSAYALTRRGLSVTVLEADELATGSSSGNAGHIVPSHVIPFAAPGMPMVGLRDVLLRQGAVGVSPSAGPALVPFLARFLAHCTRANVERAVPALRDLGTLSVQTLSSWTAEEAWASAMRPTGLLQVFHTEAGLASGVAEARHMADHGVRIAVLDGPALAALEPGLRPGAVGGVHLLDDGCLDPARLLHDLAAATTARGADVRTGVRVTGARRTDDGVVLEVSGPQGRSTVGARHVVVAAGVWSPEVARLLTRAARLPVMPARGYSVTLRLRDEAAFTHPMLLGEAHVAVTPLGDRVRITGRYELAGRERRIDEKRTRALVEAGRRYLSLPATMHVTDRWTGLRPSTPDGVPLIGRLREAPEVVVATGHGMLGTSLGPGTGELVARIVAGEPAGVATGPMDPDRFR